MSESKLDRHPPSAKLVYIVLDKEGELTQTELAEESHLPQRTVRRTLKNLEEDGIVRQRSSIHNANENIYRIEEKSKGKIENI